MDLVLEAGQSWYYWKALRWQRYELRAIVDGQWIVWRSMGLPTSGDAYELISRDLLERCYASGQLQAVYPSAAWSHAMARSEVATACSHTPPS